MSSLTVPAVKVEDKMRRISGLYLQYEAEFAKICSLCRHNKVKEVWYIFLLQILLAYCTVLPSHLSMYLFLLLLLLIVSLALYFYWRLLYLKCYDTPVIISFILAFVLSHFTFLSIHSRSQAEAALNDPGWICRIDYQDAAGNTLLHIAAQVNRAMS